jgi:hypothetical protein
LSITMAIKAELPARCDRLNWKWNSAINPESRATKVTNSYIDKKHATYVS